MGMPTSNQVLSMTQAPFATQVTYTNTQGANPCQSYSMASTSPLSLFSLLFYFHSLGLGEVRQL